MTYTSYFGYEVKKTKMKFDQAKLFYAEVKALNSATNQLFIVAVKDEQERKLRTEELEKLLDHLAPSSEKVRLNCVELKDLALFEEEVLSRSFFSDKKIVLVKGSEKLFSQVLPLLKQLPKQVMVILAIESIPDKFYQSIKTCALVLEIKEEKPWQQKERLIQAVSQFFYKENKKIAKEIPQEMVELIGLDEGTLLRFAENLLLYAADKSLIEMNDLKACLKTKTKLSSWQYVEGVLLGDKILYDRLDESMDLLGVIAQLRYKLQQILKWKSGSDEGYLAQRNRYLAVYGTIHPQFFYELSKFLFELEFSIKNGFNQGTFYLDLIQFKVHYLLNQYTQVMTK
jgi:DNA polymerase III delta subunit